MKKLNLLLVTGMFGLFVSMATAQSTVEGFGQIRSNLYIVSTDKTTTLMDGTLTQFDSTYSNTMDGLDARKMSNFSENWGMLRGNTVYIIERRKTISDKDSIFFKMWNMRIITYQLEFIASRLNFNGRTAFLIDKYLNIKTPVYLNDTTRIPFSVTNDDNSKAPDRFSLVFSYPEIIKTPPLHVMKAEIHAEHKVASLVWKTEGYSKNAVFTIQKSADGIDFQSAGELAADSALHQYTWKDHQPLQGRNNYYRIKITSQNDSTKFSSAVSVYIDKVTEGFSIFPNPVTGSRFNVNIVDEAKGTYTISLNNSFGLKLVSKSIKYSGGKHTEQFIVNKSLMKGVYRLQITGPGGFQKVISVLY